MPQYNCKRYFKLSYTFTFFEKNTNLMNGLAENSKEKEYFISLWNCPSFRESD